MILVTGRAGFIGANFVLDWLNMSNETVLNVDKLTYATNLDTRKSQQGNPQHVFVKADICDRAAMAALFAEHKPRSGVHFAAESHGDRSIHGPADFVQTNVAGTFTLPKATRQYWNPLGEADKAAFRFLHVSTDEVAGSLSATDPQFSETTPCAPNSPYSVTKAGSDHLVRTCHHTYGLLVPTTNCSNNYYGPYQYAQGFFFESFNALAERVELSVEFVQDKHSRPAKGVLRALDDQIEHAQSRLVRMPEGEVVDVAVDIRESSPNFGKWVGATLSVDNHRQPWVPPGFAHGPWCCRNRRSLSTRPPIIRSPSLREASSGTIRKLALNGGSTSSRCSPRRTRPASVLPMPTYSSKGPDYECI